MPNDPQLESQVKSKGFLLTNGGDNGTYTAVLVQPIDPEISAGSPESLLAAIDSYWARLAASKPNWKAEPRTIIA